jgi:hypothetical protein
MSAIPPNGTAKLAQRWQIAAAIIGVVVAVGTTIWSQVDKAIIAATGDMKRQVDGLLKDVDRLNRKDEDHENKIITLVAQAQRSVDDRTDLNAKVSSNTGLLAMLQSQFSTEVAERRAQAIEQEVQIDAMSQSFGIQFSDSQRTFSGIEGALNAMGAKFPMPAYGPWYFPNISARGHSQNSIAK